MNFYKRHIGDYIKDAAHLTLLEHGVYARLMDVYYTRESGIPDGQAARLIGAHSKAEQQAVNSVLTEFFSLVGGIWTQKRCESEIQAASAQADANRSNGKKGGRPPKTKTDEKPIGFHSGSDSESEKNLSQTPDSINQVIPPNPPPPDGGEGRASVRQRTRATRCTLKTFVDQCQTAGEKPISEYRPLIEYVETTGLPMEHVQLCWEVFKDEFLPGGHKESKMQTDWRKHFLNFVKRRYYQLWYGKPDGTYELTATGIQAKAYHARKAA
ncbi:YdaU family protein [Cupriavidus numazuensis]|uniref:DUF1376 domain-containing protein n=1 Tax=Cupriavidus numazuensis TaxID=221992 RepID=A0ABN7PSW3_9BURK|nr:YdaU family protein [Cupriavidus numazuensis]CAG2136080.1 hypothetical protein LMG26411_01192 [Cupriavidus numazuensis]